jgi:thiamine kinase-like enzyme
VTEFEAAIERVWPGRAARFEVLGGGITNHNVKVLVDGEGPYVLRIAGRDTALLGIDRQVEHEASLAAAELGVGPEVIRFIEPEGWLVTRFIEGEVVPVARMHEPDSLRRVAQALRAVHSGPPIPSRFDSFRVVEDYRRLAEQHGERIPDAFTRASELAARIENMRRAAPERPCHNDLLNANFIDDGTRIRIVDWEYAGMGDVAFDLANFSVNHELDRAETAELLRAYRGELRPDDVRAVTLMRFMSDFREAMWGVLQSAISELDFDFSGYAAEHFERLERTAASRTFRRALR